MGQLSLLGRLTRLEATELTQNTQLTQNGRVNGVILDAAMRPGNLDLLRRRPLPAVHRHPGHPDRAIRRRTST